jgi:hypothetical protein
MARRADHDNDFPRFLSKEEADERKRQREARLARPVDYLPANVAGARNPHWLWYRFLAYRTYSILAAKLQDIRFFVACEIIARLSQPEGADMPDGEKAIGDKKILIIADLDPTTTFMPVLDRLGAKRANIRFLPSHESMFFRLHSIEQLIRYYRDFKFDLAYVDGPTDFIGEANPSRNEEIRPILSAFCEWLRAEEVCFLLGMSVNKHGSEIDIYDRIFGCTEWRRKAATAMMATEDDQGLQLALGETRYVGRRLKQVIRWDKREDGSGYWYDCRGLADCAPTLADDDPQPKRKLTKVEEAGELIKELHREKEKWTWTEIMERAEERGIGKDSLARYRDSDEGKLVIQPGTWDRNPNPYGL